MTQDDNRLRLLILLSGFAWSGAERQSLLLARQAPHHAAECALYSVLAPGAPAQSARAGNVIEKTQEIGIQSGHLGGKSVFSPQPYWKLRRVCRQFRPHAIYTIGLRADLVARPLARWLNAPALISGIRATEEQRGRKETLLDRYTSRFVDAWISNSHAGRNIFVDREKLPADRIHVIPNAIEPWEPVAPTGEFRRAWGLSDEHLVIGTVAMLRPSKGHRDIVEAAATIVRQHPQARLVFIGEGELRAPLQAQIDRAGLTDFFRLPGHCADIPAALAEIDLFLLASYTEGMPNALMEAMVAERPCVATDVGDVARMLGDGHHGLPIPPHQPDAIAQAVLSLARDPDRARALGVTARQHALDAYYPDRMARDTLAFIRFVVEQKTGARRGKSR